MIELGIQTLSSRLSVALNALHQENFRKHFFILPEIIHLLSAFDGDGEERAHQLEVLHYLNSPILHRKDTRRQLLMKDSYLPLQKELHLAIYEIAVDWDAEMADLAIRAFPCLEQPFSVHPLLIRKLFHDRDSIAQAALDTLFTLRIRNSSLGVFFLPWRPWQECPKEASVFLCPKRCLRRLTQLLCKQRCDYLSNRVRGTTIGSIDLSKMYTKELAISWGTALFNHLQANVNEFSFADDYETLAFRSLCREHVGHFYNTLHQATFAQSALTWFYDVFGVMEEFLSRMLEEEHNEYLKFENEKDLLLREHAVECIFLFVKCYIETRSGNFNCGPERYGGNELELFQQHCEDILMTD